MTRRSQPDPSRSNVPPEKKLVPCPRGCGHEVHAGKVGDPHTATKMVNNEIILYTCKD